MTTPAPAAGPDLKTFDVPDPPRPAGWKVRCLVGVALGLAAAAGFVVALRLPHLVWVAEHHVDRWDPDELGFIQSRVIDWLQRDYDDAALRPHVLGIVDPKVRGAFHRALAGSGDPAQLDAMVAFLRAPDRYGFARSLPEVVASMRALDATQAAGKLVALYDAPGEVESDAGTPQELIAAALEATFKPEELAPHAVKVADPARRGRLHAALATTKDPAQLDAVLAYARTVVPTSPGAERPDEWGPVVASLAAFGPPATPRLQAVLEQTESRALVSLAAEALRASDLPFLVARARALLDEYDAGVRQLALDAQLVSDVDDGSREDADPEALAAARARLEVASAKAFMIFEILRALEPLRGDQAVDFCVVRGLSTFNREIAEWSALRIKERFTPDQLVDTLFSYIAQKTQFAVAEVEVYEGLMKELGEPGAARVATNLERLLREARGDPDDVFWLYKKMGFTLLAELGRPEAVPVLRRYLADTGSYVLTTTTTDGSGRRSRREEEKRYADEARAAIEAIEARGPAGPTVAPAPATPATPAEGGR